MRSQFTPDTTTAATQADAAEAYQALSTVWQAMENAAACPQPWIQQQIREMRYVEVDSYRLYLAFGLDCADAAIRAKIVACAWLFASNPTRAMVGALAKALHDFGSTRGGSLLIEAARALGRSSVEKLNQSERDDLVFRLLLLARKDQIGRVSNAIVDFMGPAFRYFARSVE